MGPSLEDAGCFDVDPIMQHDAALNGHVYYTTALVSLLLEICKREILRLFQ